MNYYWYYTSSIKEIIFWRIYKITAERYTIDIAG